MSRSCFVAAERASVTRQASVFTDSGSLAATAKKGVEQHHDKQCRIVAWMLGQMLQPSEIVALTWLPLDLQVADSLAKIMDTGTSPRAQGRGWIGEKDLIWIWSLWRLTPANQMRR